MKKMTKYQKIGAIGLLFTGILFVISIVIFNKILNGLSPFI